MEYKNTSDLKSSLSIAGVLKDPIIRKLPDGVSITYHWETHDKKHTFLYITVTKNLDNKYAVARENIDSQDIKGQGDALWKFLTERIQELSDGGIGNEAPVPIIHEVNVNSYSKRLPEADPRYTRSKTDTNVFYSLFLPK